MADAFIQAYSDYGTQTPQLTPAQLSGLSVMELWAYHNSHPGDLVAGNAAINAVNSTPGSYTYGGYGGSETWTGAADAANALAAASAAPYVAQALTQTYNVGGGQFMTGSEIGGGVPSTTTPGTTVPDTTPENILPEATAPNTTSNVFSCPFCGATFSSQAELDSHKLLVHGVDTQGNVVSEPQWPEQSTGVSGGTNVGYNTEESYSPFTAYLQAKGLGNKNYYNPAESYTISQYEPLKDIYDVRRLMSLANPSFDPGNYLGSWASQNTGGSTALARQTLADLMGMNQEQQGLTGLSFDPTYSGTDTVGSGSVGYLQSLLKTGLRGVLGNYLSSKLPWEQQNWGNYQSGGGSGTFLDWLMQKYPIGSLIQ